MSISLSSIFAGYDTALKIANYLGLIESTDFKINRLVDMHRKAAVLALKHALNVDIHSQVFNTYLNRAAEKYFDAIAVSKNLEELFNNYVGLAFCNHLLLDSTNMEINIIKAIGAYKRIKDYDTEVDSMFEMYTKPDAILLRIVTFGLADLINEGTKALKRSQIKEDEGIYKRSKRIGEGLLSNFNYLDTDDNHRKYSYWNDLL